ncbi:exopolysaccharide biosynthesis polyprenyl glycosylphosphotransferase [Candidatus Peribacteria bacterium]|nr:exopolysaccharide biosynthesis polyprenyl glycosylphosphotransferase [Candidatus Peribacteria bacterium]
MKRSEILFGIIRIPLDGLSAFAALLLAYTLRAANIDLIPNLQLLPLQSNLPTPEYYLLHFALPATLAYVLVAAALRLYALKTTLGPWREMNRIIMVSALWVVLIMAWYFLVQKQLFFSRILLVHATIFVTMFALVLRSCVFLLQRHLLRRGIGIRTVVSCGSRELPMSMIAELEHDVRYRYLGHETANTGVAAKHCSEHIDLVLHSDPNPTSVSTIELIDYCRSHQIGYAFVPPVFTDVPHQLSIGHLGLVPILRFEPTPLDGWGRVIKRLLDLIFGMFLIIILSPLLLLVALLIALTCGFPVLYVSTRVSQHGRTTIPLLKFRTMCKDADEKKKYLIHLSHRSDGPLFKIKHDPRVTSLGRILRRFSIDELPQLLNVIAGHLSLVGPRPHLTEEVAKYTQSQRRVFTVRPGITGLAQISGRSNLPFNEEVTLDMRYIEDWSLTLDLWILWRTFFVVLFGRGAD